MLIKNNVPISDYTTMRIGGKAEALALVNSKLELLNAVGWAKENNLPLLVIGGGSNVIFKDGYNGLLIINRISGMEIIKDNGETLLRVGAGEVWDDVVAYSTRLGLYGIECMSGIPGRMGGMPVQNAGAYGSEIADTLEELEIYDTKTDSFKTLSRDDCGFEYRNSIFKKTSDRRYIITTVTLRLSKTPASNTYYDSLQKYLDENKITDRSSATIRKAVLAVRESKLPNPLSIANSGSFFKNPIISAEKALDLKNEHPDMPQWALPNGDVKLPAGWLMDHAGLKGYRSHGMEVYNKNALIIVNREAKDYDDLAAFQQEIVGAIQKKYGVELEQEPELFE